ncbi:MAG: VWA domain-containing protein [Acidobacteria bacterium]|nr:VWA domain-containing protein [Acidobacteriota bacterium]
MWGRQLAARRRDAHRLTSRRQVPVRERFPVIAPAMFPLCLVLAVALLVVAIARPRIVTALVRTGGADVVVLLDGSASMSVADVDGNRWQRAVQFLHTFGDSLGWQRDRIALTLFARIAAPQVRLTSDPNTYFFFLDHMAAGSPFPLEDDTTWDTNIALGIDWGLRVIDKDEELRGPSENAGLFVLLSDGQSWSGVVDESLAAVRTRGFPVFVVGVGTAAGGIIPDPLRSQNRPPVRSRLDRASLTRIATATGGQYFELGRASDADIAVRIVDAARRRAGPASVEPQRQDIYLLTLSPRRGRR